MGNWRARLVLPSEIDDLIRTEAIKGDKQLKVFVHCLLDHGIRILKENNINHPYNGLDKIHSFTQNKMDSYEYIVDEEYRKKVSLLEPLFSGRGKRGKTLQECIMLGLLEKKVI